MSKFKIGDRVKITDDSGSSCAHGRIGDVGKVIGLTGHDSLTSVRMEGGEVINMYAHRFELVPTLTISADKFYRTRNGKVTGRVTVGDTGFEAVVDGKVRIFDAAGGHVHGDADLDIVEAWVPRVGERVIVVKTDNFHPAVSSETECVVDSVNGDAIWLNASTESAGVLYQVAYLSDLEPLPVAAPQPAAPALKIEAGRYYRTRDGRKVGPMKEVKGNWPFKCSQEGGPFYEADGTAPHLPDKTIIAEWIEPSLTGSPVAPTPVSAQVDAINEEYGPVVAASRPKFKVGDRVVFRNYSGGEHCYGTVEDVSVDGKRVLASDWSIGAEVGYLPVADLELADAEPDTTLHLKFTSDFSELDAAILVRKKKLKKLIKLARKAGIELREAA